MQSFREQSNYHGSQQTYPPEAHGTSRIEEYSPRQQAQMFQGSYGGRRGATGTPTTVTPGENSSLQSYQAYRKESGEFYYLGSKEGSAAGSQTPQRRPSGPVQNYGPPQGSNSGSTGFGPNYGREGHHSQFSGQHSATANISQYSQDFPGSFSPSGGQYPSHVPTQQLRQQLYQSHHPISQSANTSASTGASHLQQMQRTATINSSVGYPLRMGQYGQHYQSSAGSSTSYPPQRFGQSGANYEGYSPGGTNSPYESHISGSSYGTQQQGFSSYSQHLKNFESTKIAQGGNQGQPQQNPHVMQFSNSSKLITQSQTGQFNQSEVPVRSPMQFQQNFSPISNPSPAASVVQSPSCSSTPSPLMTSGENLQCSQGNVQHPSRNRILPMMPQLSPNTPIGSYKGFGVEGQPDKRLTDPGLSSLSALSSQVANLPNTVQHMLLSDALAPNKKGSKRTSRKTDSCANSETSSQAEEQLKSPMTESLDGSCSSSSGDPGERVRQLSGQSTSSEAGYKGPPSEKPASPVQGWQNEPLEKSADQDPDTVSEPAESFQEVPKPSEKSVGVIVSMETMTNRLEKVVDEVLKPVDDLPVESNLPKTEGNDNSCSNNQNGESSACDSVSATTINVSQTDSVLSSVSAGFGIKEAPTSTKYATNLPQNTKNLDSGNFGALGDRKPVRNEKIPSLLQEVLQGHHQQEGRYARSTQEHPAGMGNSEIVLRSNVLTSQANEQSNRNILGKNAAPHLEAPHWGQWERKSTLETKPINLDFPTARKFEGEVSTSSHESSSGPSERRSVICDISPLRQIVREPSGSQLLGTAQERPPDGRPGLSVILPSGMLALEKSNCLGGIAKGDDGETAKMHRKQTGEHCMLYTTKDSIRGSASPRSMTYDPNQDYSSHNSRASNPKRGTGRVGSRGRSPAQTHDLSDKLKMSPGRSRGPTEIPHMNPTVSLSERASREALYSAFFHNTDSSTLGYHTNSRASSYGEPHPAFTSPLHYKRQMYQQEEYKEWLGSSAQAILSATQHRQEMQRKSPRQEPFHVRSPGRNENEGLGYSQSSSYHKPSNIDYSRQVRMNEVTSSNMINVEMKRNSQKTPGDCTIWHLGHQASPAKKVGSPVATNQKPFSPNRESDPHISRAGESTELPQQGCSVRRPTGSEEASHHNPLIMRRRVRSFISPIPSKRQFPDDKARSALKDGADKIPAAHVVSPMDADTVFSAMAEESTKSISEERSPTAVSLSSPTKTKILPPRKGRGLKLEAIVQKITSPNIRRITTCASESSTEPVTLDDILSLKGKGPDGGSGSMQEVTERKVNVLPSISCSDEIKVKGFSPKSTDMWTIHDDKQIKKEMDEHSFENKELPQSSSIIQSSSNHFINARGDSPAFELKCPLQQVQPLELGDKDKFAGGPCPVTPKQDVAIPPKGYFPSGKKKGRPVGSVNKQKKQLQHQAQQLEEQQQAPPTITVGLTSLPAPPPPPQMMPISEHGFESELKPKRRRERRKAAGTTRRRRRQTTPIVAPLEPEIKLKYASQTIDKTETKAKSFFPYIHVENKEEIGLSCVIINAEDEEQRWKKLTSVRKGQRSTSQPTESKALPVSSFMVQGPVVTESSSVGHLVCCFCGKWANYKNLGDVFGPFYTQEYASTLSKNPPPKKSIETPKKVKVRHKDASDGSKTDSDEEDEPRQAREQRSLPAHPRFKRRNRSGDCASSRHAVPSRRKTTDSCEPNSLDSSGTSTADGVSDQGFQIPQLPLDSNEFWMHEGCVLWANGVYLVCGRLYGLQEALDIAREMICAHCQEPGATLGCYNKGCACCYHFPCAMDSECLLSEENFSVRCPKHKMKTLKGLSAEQPEQS